MEHLKGQLSLSDVPDQSQFSALNGSNLLDSSLEKILSIDDIMASICSERRKKPGKRLVLTTSCCSLFASIAKHHIIIIIIISSITFEVEGLVPLTSFTKNGGSFQISHIIYCIAIL